MEKIQEQTSVRELLAWGMDLLKEAQIDHPRRCAEQLLGHLLGLSRINLYLSEHSAIPPQQTFEYRILIRRRASHIPLQYLIGKAAFLEEEFVVDRRVLIPRPETELLVEEAIRRLSKTKNPRMIDIGTGCGNIAITLTKELGARAWATDLSGEALVVARLNAERLGVSDRITFLQGDLFAPLLSPVDLILANLTGDLLVRAAPRFRSYLHPGGVVIASGIATPHVSAVTDALARAGLVTFAAVSAAEWRALAARRVPIRRGS